MEKPPNTRWCTGWASARLLCVYVTFILGKTSAWQDDIGLRWTKEKNQLKIVKTQFDKQTRTIVQSKSVRQSEYILSVLTFSDFFWSFEWTFGHQTGMTDLSWFYLRSGLTEQLVKAAGRQGVNKTLILTFDTQRLDL